MMYITKPLLIPPMHHGTTTVPFSGAPRHFNKYHSSPIPQCNPEKTMICVQNSMVFTFTFIHLADAFIQRFKLQFLHFYQLLLSLGIEPMILALLAPCSTSWATGKLWFLLWFMFKNKKNHEVTIVLQIISKNTVVHVQKNGLTIIFHSI